MRMKQREEAPLRQMTLAPSAKSRASPACARARARCVPNAQLPQSPRRRQSSQPTGGGYQGEVGRRGRVRWAKHEAEREREQGLSPANLPPCSDACATLLLTSADDGREDHAADDRRGDRLRLAVAALLARHLALELRELLGCLVELVVWGLCRLVVRGGGTCVGEQSMHESRGDRHMATTAEGAQHDMT